MPPTPPCPGLPPAPSAPSAPSAITRRDLLHGAALCSGLGATPAAQGHSPEPAPDPALRTGLQGQTDNSLAAAHAWRDGLHKPTAPQEPAELDEGVEDLVVVGAGLSGLAGAWLFQRHAGRPVRLLLLEAADDVGGHARRNEFVSRSGVRRIGYGGSQSLDAPGLFSPAVHQLLAELGLDLRHFEQGGFDRGWAARHGVAGHGLWFDGQAWGGADRWVRRGAGVAVADWVARTPLSPAAQADWRRLLTEPRDVLPLLRTRAARRAALAGLLYEDFLRRCWQVHEEVIRFYQSDTQGYFGVGIDAVTALDAWAAGLPGFEGLDLGEAVDARQSPSGRHLKAGQDAYIYHFPDGNAGVARALLRGLVPAALPGEGMASLADAALNPAALDVAGQPVRLRLQATVVGVRHLGPPQRADRVELRYRDASGRLRAVHARQVLLACWHRVIARLCPELPARQVAALNDQVKVPLLYGTALLSNWRAWQQAGVGGFACVGGFWGPVELDFPVRLGQHAPPEHPDEPILVHLAKVVVPGNGAPARVQAAQGRAALLGWSFADLEAHTRRVLQSALGPFGLDVDRDLEALTLNRWAHGYAYEYMRPWDGFWPRGPLPCETARRGWGRVAIANSDAGAFAYAHSAIDQATRAVQELLPRARLPAWQRWPGPNPRQIGLG